MTPSTEQSSLTPTGDAAPWFGALMLEAAEACGVKISEGRVRIYAHEFAREEPHRVVEAFRRARREGKGFFPSISEVLQQLGPSTDDAALLAWTGLERAAAQVGAYASLEIEDPCTAAALLATFGSWSAYCATEMGPDLLVKRQAFLAAFREARRRQPVGAQPLRVAGLLEAGGRDHRSPASWTARLTAGGDVVQERERPTLPGGEDVRRLTAGGDDGEATTTG